MIENTQAEDDNELSVKRFRVHLPKVEHLEVDVSYSNDALYQIGLLDKIGAGVEANNLRAQKRKLQGPEARITSYIQYPLSLERTIGGFQQRWHKMAESLQDPSGIES